MHSLLGYIVCSHLSFFHFFLTYLLPYLSFPLRIDPLRFQAGCRKRRLNLAVVFCVYIVLWYISFDLRMRAFVVFSLVFSIPSQEIGFGKRLRNNLSCVEWDVKPATALLTHLQPLRGLSDVQICLHSCRVIVLDVFFLSLLCFCIVSSCHVSSFVPYYCFCAHLSVQEVLPWCSSFMSAIN